MCFGIDAIGVVARLGVDDGDDSCPYISPKRHEKHQYPLAAAAEVVVSTHGSAEERH